MTGLQSPVFEFEGYRLDVSKRSLTGPGGEPLKLLPKAFDILTYLIENSSRVVSKDELMSEIWPDTTVEENNLTQNVSSLRRAFGEKPYENRFISTIPGRGYRFVASVQSGTAELRPPEIASADVGNDQGAGGNSRSWASRPILLMAAATVLVVGAIVATVYLYQGSAPPGRVRSIAVLPFKPITPDSRDEALELGMADTLITKLGGGDELRVIPLAAVRRFAAPDADPLQAGRQLNVEAVLDGGIQIASGRVRVSAQLTRVSDGRQLWAGQFDEDLRGIFVVQDSISQRVASALATPLGNRSRKSYTENVEAYRLFMQGRYHAYKLILPELQKGIALYEQAISLDPQFAMAYVELANSYRAMVLTNDAPPAEMMPRAKAAATKAVELDGELAEAFTALAFGDFWFDWDWTVSETHFKRALELDPDSSQAHAFYSHLLSNTGRHEEAIAEVKRAREIDPINLLYAAMEGQILAFAGRLDASDLVLRAVIDLDPSFWLAHLFLTRNFIKREMWHEALASAERAKEITGGNAEATGTVGYILGKLGRVDEARAVIGELEGRSPQRFKSSYSLAQVYLGMGDRTKAVELLEKALEQKEPLVVFLKVEPKWNELNTDAKFATLLKRLRLDN